MRPRSWAQGLNGSEGGGLRRKPAICRLVEQDSHPRLFYLEGIEANPHAAGGR